MQSIEVLSSLLSTYSYCEITSKSKSIIIGIPACLKHLEAGWFTQTSFLEKTL
jgi:hypothetical protein